MNDNELEVVEGSLEISRKTVDEETNDILDRVIASNDSEEIKDLTFMFNQNMFKKNLVRIAHSNDIIDKVLAEAGRRIEKYPNEMSNKDILDYLNAMQTQIDKSQKFVDNPNPQPMLQQINNEVHINIKAGETKESRERILNAWSKILDVVGKEEDIIEGDGIILDKEN